MALVRELDYDISFSFVYSPRPGTPAASLPDDTPMAVKKERLTALQAQLRRQAANHAEAMVGTRQRVLVTGHAKRDPGELAGRTETTAWSISAPTIRSLAASRMSKSPRRCRTRCVADCRGCWSPRRPRDRRREPRRLADDYASAWVEWCEDAEPWYRTTNDGMRRARARRVLSD